MRITWMSIFLNWNMSGDMKNVWNFASNISRIPWSFQKGIKWIKLWMDMPFGHSHVTPNAFSSSIHEYPYVSLCIWLSDLSSSLFTMSICAKVWQRATVHHLSALLRAVLDLPRNNRNIRSKKHTSFCVCVWVCFETFCEDTINQLPQPQKSPRNSWVIALAGKLTCFLGIFIPITRFVLFPAGHVQLANNVTCPPSPAK